MTKEEKDIFYQKLRDEKKQLKENLKKALTSDFIIVFDLDFNSSMGYNEIKSLIIQLGYCYSINKKNKNKISFYLTNYDGFIKEELEKMGSKSWYSHFEKEQFYNIEKLIKLNKEFIYLSPDSNEELNEVSTDKIYIIGGLVDKPVIKDKTILRISQINNYDFIKEKGIKIKSAKLPLFKYLNNIANPVLNLNTVVEILSNYMDIKDWKKAIELSIPQRNLKKE
jgi:tRNA (guanine9-N1)-methyltransferase